MIGEFDLPMEIVDRKVTKMKMISPSNREVDVGKTLSEREYIGMCRREVRFVQQQCPTATHCNCCHLLPASPMGWVRFMPGWQHPGALSPCACRAR